jgi:hypothetical protein
MHIQSPPSILLYGHDLALLETRRLVLLRTGCSVWTASNLAAMEKTCASLPITLLVLCHTLSQQECERALELARRHRRELKSMVVTAGTYSPACSTEEMALDLFAGPAMLVATVRGLLESRQE